LGLSEEEQEDQISDFNLGLSEEEQEDQIS